MSMGMQGSGLPGPQGDCANHPGAAVTALCNRCGDFICDACKEETPTGDIYCSTCVNRHVRVAEGPLEWEHREQYGLFGGFFLTVKNSLLSPSTFFPKIDPQGSYGEPLAYASICWVFAIVATLLQQSATFFLEMSDENFIRGIYTELYQNVFQGEPLFIGLGVVGLLFFIVFAVLFGALLRSGLFHMCVMVVGANKEGFRGTWRLSNYTAGVQLIGGLIGVLVVVFGIWHSMAFLVLSVIGQLAGLAVFAYDLVLVAMGIRNIHRATTGQAAGAVLLYVASFVLLCCGTYLAFLLPFVAFMPGSIP